MAALLGGIVAAGAVAVGATALLDDGQPEPVVEVVDGQRRTTVERDALRVVVRGPRGRHRGARLGPDHRAAVGRVVDGPEHRRAARRALHVAHLQRAGGPGWPGRGAEASSNRQSVFSGVSLVDTVNANRHLVLRDAAEDCLCSGLPGQIEIGPPAVQVFPDAAMFPAPPEDVTTMDVVFPRFGTFELELEDGS